MDGTPDTYWDLLFGYGAIWLLIVLALWRVTRTQGALSKELEDLKREVGASE